MSETDEVTRLKYIVDDLFRCIRDGVELNYESWVVWQAIARGVIAFNLPNRVKEIDGIDECIDIYRERLDSFRSMTTDDILSGARATIAMFNSL